MAKTIIFADLVQDSARIIKRMEPQSVISHIAAAPTCRHGDHSVTPLPELCSGIHEWFYGDRSNLNYSKSEHPSITRPLGRRWWPAALTLIAWMAGRILSQSEQKYLFWIGGPHFQPTIQILAAILPDHSLLKRCIFLDLSNRSDHLWAIDQILRSHAAAVVIADAAGADIAASRRWQLAAAAGGVCGLLARPPWEIQEQCLAITRWQVQPLPSATVNPQWRVRPLRCKPPMESTIADTQWTVQWCYNSATGQGDMKQEVELY
ncbi:MAG: hypothetical protein ACP5VQ_02610 [Phycisphaerae bacterium]